MFGRKRNRRKRMVIGFIVFIAMCIAGVIGSRVYINRSTREMIYSAQSVPHCRVAMVLGAKVFASGRLSQSLQARVDTAIRLYDLGKVDKILMSGDNRFIRYNEPKHMRQYAIAHGVPADDVVCDFAGRRTYDSVYRAKHIFGLNKMIVVTQPFHLGRSLFLCNHLGVEAYGVKAHPDARIKARMREVPACTSAIFDVYLRHPKPVMGKKERI